MRFASFLKDGQPGLAVDRAGTLHGLTAGETGFPGTLDDLLAAGADLAAIGTALADAPVVDPATVTITPPLTRPSKILCIGLNYATHAEETGREPPVYPTVFTRFASTLVGDGGALVRPRASPQLDYEGELAVVIGRTGRHIPMARALDHVAGYAIFNDASVRDFQTRSSQWTMGKNFDATGGFGPALVTADDVPRGGKGLRLTTRLNGQVVQDSTTDDMIFDVVTLITVISEVMTLVPGDIIVTGTPSGVGVARTPKLFLRPGDVCEVEIERLGILRNPVVAET